MYIHFLFVNWNVNPKIFRVGGFALRYYSLMFLAAFFFSYLVLSKIYKRGNIPIILLNKLLLYVLIGTLVGARLGHTLFYEFGYFKNHLLEIILPFRIQNGKFEFTGYRGLASHGGAIGILLAVALYCKKYKQSFLWVIDRLVIVVALSGFFIRLGNLLILKLSVGPLIYRGHLFLKELILFQDTRRSCTRHSVICSSFLRSGSFIIEEGNNLRRGSYLVCF
jgi:prolipoprotein diacylglyceryltransferase